MLYRFSLNENITKTVTLLLTLLVTMPYRSREASFQADGVGKIFYWDVLVLCLTVLNVIQFFSAELAMVYILSQKRCERCN